MSKVNLKREVKGTLDAVIAEVTELLKLVGEKRLDALTGQADATLKKVLQRVTSA